MQEIKKKQAENVQYADTGYTVCMFVLKSQEGVSKSSDRFKYQYEEAKMKYCISKLSIIHFHPYWDRQDQDVLLKCRSIILRGEPDEKDFNFDFFFGLLRI